MYIHIYIPAKTPNRISKPHFHLVVCCSPRSCTMLYLTGRPSPPHLTQVFAMVTVQSELPNHFDVGSLGWDWLALGEWDWLLGDLARAMAKLP